jgi:hypothetical protein
MANKGTTAPVRPLRTVQDLIEAGEWMFAKQEAGELDAKAADALNTTLKGQSKFVVDTPMALLKIWVRAQEKKFVIPPRMLPPGMESIGFPTTTPE